MTQHQIDTLCPSDRRIHDLVCNGQWRWYTYETLSDMCGEVTDRKLWQELATYRNCRYRAEGN